MWRTDVQNAPRSFIQKTPIMNGGKPKLKKDGTVHYREALVKRKVWVYWGGGQKCGLSWWIPDKKRWCGANQGKEPEAYIPLPEEYK